RAAGDHPFGAVLVLDGRVVVEARNTVVTSRSPICHAETNLVSEAVQQLSRETLAKSVVYASCEPCAMCAGAMYWAGIRAVVYGLPCGELAKLAGSDFRIPCRELFSRTSEPVSVTGPLLVDEARSVHLGFWPVTAT
ncbi:MAG TPA: nucleoside deaminase, partial [Gemmatimonadales bacterium]|nr:nucleoside deaminase [Gemmatimonadales bacterium]